MGYPLWDLFVTMLELFIWIVLIVLVVWVILSILRSHDLSAWAKVGWLILVIILPFIGVFAYLIVRGAHLAEEQVATANAPQDERFRRYERFEAQGRGDAGPDPGSGVTPLPARPAARPAGLVPGPPLTRGFSLRAGSARVIVSWGSAGLLDDRAA